MTAITRTLIAAVALAVTAFAAGATMPTAPTGSLTLAAEIPVPAPKPAA